MPTLLELAAALPKCAQTCIAAAAKSSTCAADDIACFCKGLGTSSASVCIKTTCSIEHALSTTNSTKTLCGVKPAVNHAYEPVLYTFLGIAAIFVALRFLARFVMKMKLWWDDWFNFAAMAFCTIYTAHAMTLKDGGWGTDMWAVPFGNLEHQLHGYYIQAMLYVSTRLLIRISYLLFYLRIFETMARKLILITLGITILTSVPLILTAAFQCTPVNYFWTKIYSEVEGKCINSRIFLWIGWIILLVNDFVVLLLPIPLIYRLQLSLKKKMMASVMFMLGVVVTATSIYKLTLIDLYTDKSNPTYNTVIMYVWAGVEIDLSVVCACLPCLPVLFRPFFSRLGGSTKASNGYSNGYPGPASHYAQISGKKSLSNQRSLASHNDPEDQQIRMTTTIQQQLSQYNDSEAQLAKPIELQTRAGGARVNHWD